MYIIGEKCKEMSKLSEILVMHFLFFSHKIPIEKKTFPIGMRIMKTNIKGISFPFLSKPETKAKLFLIDFHLFRVRMRLIKFVQ